MIDKPVAAVRKADVDAIVASGRVEDRTIDYKRELPGGSDEQRREFLRDVSSFANGMGGDILYGVEEAGGVPTVARGVTLSNFDELRRRLQSTVDSNLDPRLPAVDIVEVSGFPDGSVVLVRVYQSWRAPHMVTFKGLGKFYVRGNGQRHEMDVTELRAAFVGSEGLRERIRAFRDGRFAHVVSGQSPMRTFLAPAVVVHVLPVGGGFTSADLDPRRIDSNWMLLNREGEAFELVRSPVERPNLDGLLIYSPSYDERVGGSPSYIQVFRNGGAEFVVALCGFKDGGLVPATWINGPETEAQILDIVGNARSFRQAMGLAGPVVVSVALLRVNGLPFGTERLVMQFGRGRTFDRDVVVLPDVLLDVDADLHSTLRVVFDALWQAAGSHGSTSYAADGSYTRKRIR